jgi:hypothetical protein
MEKADEESLEKCIKTLNNTGHLVEEKRVIDVYYRVNGVGEKKPIASIFPDDRYIQFHEEFTQIGIKVPGLKDLIQWKTNHT